MKEAIIGTDDYHDTMKQVAQNGMQRMAGYKPQIADMSIELPPVGEKFAVCADHMVQHITLDHTLINCNPRCPYLFLAWLLIGSDNIFRNSQYIEDDLLHRQVAILHIRIVLGDVLLTSEILETMNAASTCARAIAADVRTDSSTTLANAEAARAASRAARAIVSDTPRLSASTVTAAGVTCAYNVDDFAGTLTYVRRKLSQRMQEWAYISDAKALQIVQQLLFDILDVGT